MVSGTTRFGPKRERRFWLTYCHATPKSNRMFRRIRDGLGVEVAKAFGYEESPTEALEQRVREATLAKDWELVGRLSAELARKGRQAG